MEKNSALLQQKEIDKIKMKNIKLSLRSCKEIVKETIKREISENKKYPSKLNEVSIMNNTYININVHNINNNTSNITNHNNTSNITNHEKENSNFKNLNHQSKSEVDYIRNLHQNIKENKSNNDITIENLKEGSKIKNSTNSIDLLKSKLENFKSKLNKNGHYIKKDKSKGKIENNSSSIIKLSCLENNLPSSKIPKIKIKNNQASSLKYYDNVSISKDIYSHHILIIKQYLLTFPKGVFTSINDLNYENSNFSLSISISKKENDTDNNLMNKIKNFQDQIVLLLKNDNKNNNKNDKNKIIFDHKNSKINGNIDDFDIKSFLSGEIVAKYISNSSEYRLIRHKRENLNFLASSYNSSSSIDKSKK